MNSICKYGLTVCFGMILLFMVLMLCSGELVEFISKSPLALAVGYMGMLLYGIIAELQVVHLNKMCDYYRSRIDGLIVALNNTSKRMSEYAAQLAKARIVERMGNEHKESIENINKWKMWMECNK